MAELISLPVKQARSAARERLLEAAARIFYAEGINAIGVDRVITEANVTRSTFYRHFPGKDDLVAAYVSARDDAIRELVAGAPAGAAEDERPAPVVVLRLLVHGIGDEICSRGFRGCPFINAAAEFPDPSSAVHQAVLAHRRWFRVTLSELLNAAGSPDPDYAARTLVMLRDGAMVGGYLEEPEATRVNFVRTAETLIPGG